MSAMLWRINQDGNLRRNTFDGEIVMMPSAEMWPKPGPTFGRTARFRIAPFDPNISVPGDRIGMYFVFGGYEFPIGGGNVFVLRRAWTVSGNLQVARDTLLERELFEEDEYPQPGDYCRVWVEMA